MIDFIYITFAIILSLGCYIMFAMSNLFVRLIGLTIFQSASLIYYVSLGKINPGIVPLLVEKSPNLYYSNPLPQVLMLTAIVVGFSTLSVGIALVLKIKEHYKTIDETKLPYWTSDE